MDDRRRKIAEAESEALGWRYEAVRRLQTGNLDVYQRQHLIDEVQRAEELLQKVALARVSLDRFEARQAGWTQILTGIGIALIGGAITGGTYLLAEGGGTYVVAWGAVAFGMLRALMGAFKFLSNG